MTDQDVVAAGEFGRTAVLVGVGIDLTMATIGALIFSAGSDRLHGAASILGPLSLGCIVAFPGFLALLGLWNRPWLLAVGGVLLFPMCFLSFSFLFFPLAIPANIFLTVAIVQPRPRPRPWAQCVAAVLSFVFVVAALLSLWVHDGGRTRDVISMQAALTSLGFFVAAVAVAALAPRDGAAAPR